MRPALASLALAAFSLVLAQPVLADEPPPATAAEERPPDAQDSVLLLSGEVVRGVVRASAGGVTVRLRSGEEREIPSAEIRRINRWAAPPPPPPAAVESGPTPTETRWYGPENVAVDALALGLGVFAIGLGERSQTALATFGYASLGVYALGSPIVHAFHHDSLGTSLGSFGLRVGLPLALGLVTYAASQPGVDSCNALPEEKQPELGCGLGQALGTVFMGGVGMLAAMIIDDAFLARETVKPEAPHVSLAPLLLPRGSSLAPQGGTGLALAARF